MAVSARHGGLRFLQCTARRTATAKRGAAWRQQKWPAYQQPHERCAIHGGCGCDWHTHAPIQRYGSHVGGLAIQSPAASSHHRHRGEHCARFREPRLRRGGRWGRAAPPNRRFAPTYYDRLSRDALIDRPLSSELGIASRQENIGSVRNRGVEGLLSLTAVENHRLTWDMSVNGSLNHNRLEEIGAGIAFIGGSPNSRSMQGYPLFSRFARPILGFADANRNGIIEASEIQVGDGLAYVGQSFPPKQLTVSSSLTLLGGDLNIATQFDHRGGNRIVNFNESNRCSITFNDCRAVNDPGTPLADQPMP